MSSQALGMASAVEGGSQQQHPRSSQPEGQSPPAGRLQETPSATARSSNIPWGRFPDYRDEAAFLIVLGRASRKVALTARVFCALAWCLGARQVAMILRGRLGEPLRRGQRLTYMTLLVTQLSCVVRELSSMMQLARGSRRSSSPPPQAHGQQQRSSPPELFHDVIKYKTLEHEAIASMVCVILLGPSHFTFAQGLKGLYFNSFIAVVDQMRVESTVKLHVAKLASLVLMEAGRCLYGSFSDMRQLTCDVLCYLLFGVVLPLLVHAVMEARMRRMFLEQYNRPLEILPAIFQKALDLMINVTAPCETLKQLWQSGFAMPLPSMGPSHQHAE